MYWFKELSVQKDGEKKSFISFQPGLNLILGPSDTGKTLIFQCLDFLLGASELPKSPLPSYDSVDAVLSTKDGSLSIRVRQRRLARSYASPTKAKNIHTNKSARFGFNY